MEALTGFDYCANDSICLFLSAIDEEDARKAGEVRGLINPGHNNRTIERDRARKYGEKPNDTKMTLHTPNSPLHTERESSKVVNYMEF